MTARTHDAFALASLVTISAFYQPESLNLYTAFTAIIANNIGALIPDMDSAGNRLWDLFPVGDQLGKIFRRVFYKHRTLSHSFLGVFIIYKILQILLSVLLNPEFIDPDVVLAATMVGYISHIIADSLTEEGVPLLFPIRVNFGFPPISSWRMKTGKWFEKFVVYPAIWVYLLWFIERYKENLILIIQLIKA